MTCGFSSLCLSFLFCCFFVRLLVPFSLLFVCLALLNRGKARLSRYLPPSEFGLLSWPVMMFTCQQCIDWDTQPNSVSCRLSQDVRHKVMYSTADRYCCLQSQPLHGVIMSLEMSESSTFKNWIAWLTCAFLAHTKSDFDYLPGLVQLQHDAKNNIKTLYCICELAQFNIV